MLTYLPYYYVQPLLTLLIGLYRVIVKGESIKTAFEYYKIPDYPDDKFDVHHWDLGFYPTTKRKIRSIFKKHFAIIEEKTYVKTNCVFYILRKTEND